MTEALQRAFTEVSTRLSPQEQDALAEVLLKGLATRSATNSALTDTTAFWDAALAGSLVRQQITGVLESISDGFFLLIGSGATFTSTPRRQRS